MRVLIACEKNSKIRDAFHKLNHDAWSCDLQSSAIPGNHLQCDIRDIPLSSFDLMIAHPPCTHLSVSGARWFKDKQDVQKDAIAFFMFLVNAPVKKICIENPIGIMSTLYREPDQYIHPWEYGHWETKKTCLWLKGLPPLVPTSGFKDRRFVKNREQRIFKMPPSPNRGDLRSVTYDGWAQAMADQWGGKND